MTLTPDPSQNTPGTSGQNVDLRAAILGGLCSYSALHELYDDVTRDEALRMIVQEHPEVDLAFAQALSPHLHFLLKLLEYDREASLRELNELRNKITAQLSMYPTNSFALARIREEFDRNYKGTSSAAAFEIPLTAEVECLVSRIISFFNREPELAVPTPYEASVAHREKAVLVSFGKLYPQRLNELREIKKEIAAAQYTLPLIGTDIDLE